MTTVIVGVDGSDEAHRALRFAVEEAKFRAARLRVICAWELPVGKWGEFPPPEESLHGPRRRAEELAAEVAAIVEKLAPNVECECLAVEGEAGDVLLERSSDASMIVIGRHGHGRVADALGPVGDLFVGSVSQHIVRGARCPVVVVPHASSPE